MICKVHGFCVAGGTDMALCSDLLVIADDARIGYPPARVWGVPTSTLWAHRDRRPARQAAAVHRRPDHRRQALDWGLAIEAPPAAELDERFEALLARIALTPVNQLVMMKLLVNQALFAQGLQATQALGVFFDGIARHTPEGYAFHAARPRPASSRPCASATSRTSVSATSLSEIAGQSSNRPANRPTTAPCGSWATRIRPPGTSSGGTMTCPPSSPTRAASASTSSLPK